MSEERMEEAVKRYVTMCDGAGRHCDVKAFKDGWQAYADAQSAGPPNFISDAKQPGTGPSCTVCGAEMVMDLTLKHYKCLSCGSNSGLTSAGPRSKLPDLWEMPREVIVQLSESAAGSAATAMPRPHQKWPTIRRKSEAEGATPATPLTDEECFARSEREVAAGEVYPAEAIDIEAAPAMKPLDALKRYDLHYGEACDQTDENGCSAEMEESAIGEWVKFSDIAGARVAAEAEQECRHVNSEGGLPCGLPKGSPVHFAVQSADYHEFAGRSSHAEAEQGKEK